MLSGTVEYCTTRMDPRVTEQVRSNKDASKGRTKIFKISFIDSKILKIFYLILKKNDDNIT